MLPLSPSFSNFFFFFDDGPVEGSLTFYEGFGHNTDRLEFLIDMSVMNCLLCSVSCILFVVLRWPVTIADLLATYRCCGYTPSMTECCIRKVWALWKFGLL